MLTYHPAFDVYNCAFRELLLLENLSTKQAPIGLLRVLDFYLLFPELAEKCKLPKELSSYKKELKTLRRSYCDIQEPLRVFAQLEPYQDAALEMLVSCGLISSEDLKRGMVVRTSALLPMKIAEQLMREKQENQLLVDFLCNHFAKSEFYGKSGIKSRTGLLEFNYDSK